LLFFYFKDKNRSCSFEGYDWIEIEKTLGKPNSEYISGNNVVKRYDLTEIKEPGLSWRLSLDISVNLNGKVVKTRFLDDE